MRLAVKLALALMAGLSILLAMQGLVQVRRVAELERQEAREEVASFAHSLCVAVGEIWKHSGEAAARAFLLDAEERRSNTRLELQVPPSPNPFGPGATERAEDQETLGLRMLAPVLVDGIKVADLVIEQRFHRGGQYVRSFLWTQVGMTLGAIVLSTALALWLAFRVIVTPLRRLSRFAERVAEGDFRAIAEVERSDEIGHLARQLNAMAARLAETQARERAEAHERTVFQEQLRQADRLSTVGKIASSIAHELGTPLNVVSGRAAMIAGDEEVPGEVRDSADSISEQARRMTETIRGLVDFSRRKPLERRETRLVEVLEQARSLLAPITEKAHVEVLITGEVDAAAAIDRHRILQVLTNLMMNSVQALSDGGSIVLSVERTHISEPDDRHADTGDFVRIAVRDGGCGIPAEQLEEIFAPFFSTKWAGPGTGLGLSVCHSIVREHGGWIDVQSELDKGSEFAIYLPEREAP